jgi:hypothetical protein
MTRSPDARDLRSPDHPSTRSPDVLASVTGYERESRRNGVPRGVIDASDASAKSRPHEGQKTGLHFPAAIG